MSKQKEQLDEQQDLARGGTYNKDEIREKTIRIRKTTYERLKKRGEFGMDFDDVVTRVLDDLEQCEKEHRVKK